MRLSLRWKLVLGCVLVEVVMLSFLVANSLRLNHDHMLQLVDLRLKEVSVLLNASIAPALAQEDYAAINDVFRSSRRKDGIVYFLLFDHDHHLIVSNGWDSELPQDLSHFQTAKSPTRIDARLPVTLAGLPYGDLMFGVNTQFVLDARNNLLKESILIAAVEILLSFIFIALLGSWLTRHLKRLEVAANAISRGEYGLRIAHTGNDEVGIVGRALNVMGEQLERDILTLKHSEQQQRETAERLQSVFEAVPDYLTLSKLDNGMIVYANAGFEAITGYTRNETMGKTSLEMGIWLDIENRKRWVKIVKVNGYVSDYQTSILAKDGTVKAILLSAKLLNIDGVPHIVTICKDITERLESEVKVEMSRRKLQAVLDAASEVSIIATDVYGKITMFNSGAEKMLGYSADEFLGRLTPAPFHDKEELRERSRQLSKQFSRHISGIEIFTAIAIRDGSDFTNWTYIHKSGKRINVSLVVTTMRDEFENVVGFLGIARDITPQVEARAALSKLNDELESRVVVRTAELKTANDELAEAMEKLQLAQDELIRSEKLKALGNIVAVVAHELNTPIGNSLTVASTLREKTKHVNQLFAEGGLRKSSLSEYLSDADEGTSILIRALNRSSDLVNNFKHVAVDQTTEQRRPFDLHDVIVDVVAVLSPMLRKTPYRFNFEVPSGILMDSYPGPLEQVVTNLITNSLAHAFEDKDQGEMYLSASLLDDNTVQIIFTDDGIGIETDHLSRIFDPFYTTKLGRGGTGLGLNIVHNIATKTLGGNLSVESIYGKGTVFTLNIPLKAPI
ncbi:PAS domain-containing sensor histidine kinase [Undibacterium jejuense]|uniref:histidine kinase n=1 Tax=Undibacterium jejuense TaxID=1344949 RepID=A0A923HLC0_9BURK|nr:PAS domain-containing sensor histidine kinase [Undibacterium jejuense]MBC3862984.1 PAS domain-containing sensor histidine kinase [Undibacterium jejuense]